MAGIAERLKEVRRRVAAAAERAGREPSEVEIVAVSKRMPAAAVEEAVAAGQLLFGENYVQEAQEKAEALGHLAGSIRWHLIGHLQGNKARRAVSLFHCIETVDSLKLGRRLSRLAVELERELEVMVQVNIGRDPAKAGVSREEALGLVEELSALPGLVVTGLMTIHPYSPEPQAARPWFRALAALFSTIRERLELPRFRHLSMGMSRDFEIAVEEGATLVRVGTAIFGPRPLG